MTDQPAPLPRWDMTPVFPGPESPEFTAAFAAAVGAITDLADRFESFGVGPRVATPLDDGTVAAVEEVIARFNAVLEAVGLLESYLSCLVATDATDAPAQAALSELRQQGVRLVQLGARFTAWIGSLDVEAVIERSTVASEHAFPLRQACRAAAHLMTPAEEDLAAALGPTGAGGWFRMRQDLEARLTVRLELDGEVRTIPISEAFNLGFHPDRDVRRRAHEGERNAWRSVEVPLTAALNGVKGETNALTARRNWPDPLDAALDANRIDRPTLDALLVAIREAFPDFRRYLRAKARALGLPALAWYDLNAPVVADERPWPFPEATAFIVEQFGGFSGKLAALATRAVAERWIDAEPRVGKEGGGFCANAGNGASRILLNYAPTYLWMSALAHELGHAYHNAVHHEFGRTWLQRSFPPPMTLAETASTFCETLIQRAALAQAGEVEQLAILGGWLQSVSLNVFTSIDAFDFERELFAARRRRDLATDELCELTLWAQRETFGDALDPESLHPYLWAVAPHPFLPDLWYYNFPYAFGMLFGIGLYARYEADPEAFRAGFDDLLSRTGMAEAADLAASFGIDLRSPEFWQASLALIRADVDRFETLVDRVGPRPDRIEP